MRTVNSSRASGLWAFVALIGMLVMSSGFALMATAGSANAVAPTKYFVCKYTGPPPGTPHHIISVAAPSTSLGQFNDAHDSYVLVEDTGQPEPSVSACPGYDQPPELCPANTDRAGLVVGNNPCDNPPELCPANTDRAGLVVGNNPCDNPPELCPTNTDRAHEPKGTDPCDNPPELCPANTDRAHEPKRDRPVR